MIRQESSLVVLPGIVALAILVVFIVRDGFAWGDVLGAAVIGLAVLAILALMRRFARR